MYYGSAKLGLSLAFETKSVTAIWPPTGIALAALVIWGRSVWPGVALGAFLANLWTGVPLITVVGITTGNTLEAIVGAYLLSWLADFRPSLERLRDVLALVFLAGIISTAIAATVGVTSLIVGDEVSFDDFGSVWRTWWLGDMGGDLLVAPVLMVLVAQWPLRGLPGRALEAMALAGALVGVSIFVFHHTSGAYLIFPLLIWATLRFWQPGATMAVLTVAGIAVYYTAHGHGPYVRGDPDESLLLAQTFFGVAAITMMSLGAVLTERARAEETVAYIAGALQDGLLPPALPEIPGIDLAARFRPVGQDYRVGGDFYDVFESRPGRWIVVVGDVSGKGPNAAAVTGLARHTLRTAALHDDSPSRVLSVLNGALRERLSPREVCTVVYARLELVEGGFALTVSSGGHPLPLLLRSGGTVHEVGAHGLVLGANPELELAESTVTLRAGDCLLLYTDGLTEAYAPAYASVRPDMQSLLEAHPSSSANEIAEDVYRRMLEFSPSEPRDDVALVVLRIGEVAPDRLDSAAHAGAESRG